MKKKFFKATLAVAAVATVGLSSFRTYQSYTIEKQLAYSALVTDNVQANAQVGALGKCIWQWVKKYGGQLVWECVLGTAAYEAGQSSASSSEPTPTTYTYLAKVKTGNQRTIPDYDVKGKSYYRTQYEWKCQTEASTINKADECTSAGELTWS